MKFKLGDKVKFFRQDTLTTEFATIVNIGYLEGKSYYKLAFGQDDKLRCWKFGDELEAVEQEKPKIRWFKDGKLKKEN